MDQKFAQEALAKTDHLIEMGMLGGGSIIYI